MHVFNLLQSLLSQVFQLRVNFVKDVQKQEAMWERQHEIAADKIFSMCSDLGGFFLKVFLHRSILLFGLVNFTCNSLIEFLLLLLLWLGLHLQSDCTNYREAGFGAGCVGEKACYVM
jgi:hypothetical protein